MNIYEFDPYLNFSACQLLTLSCNSPMKCRPLSEVHYQQLYSLFFLLARPSLSSFYFYISKIDRISYVTCFISEFLKEIQNTVNNIYIISSNVNIINYINVKNNPCAHERGIILEDVKY